MYKKRGGLGQYPQKKQRKRNRLHVPKETCSQASLLYHERNQDATL